MIRLVKTAAAAIANAAAGKVWFFINDSGVPATKDENGNVNRFATEASVGSAIFAEVKNSIEVDSADDDLQLVGDTPSPGNNKFYATDGSGNRGWQDAPGATSLEDDAPAALGTASAGTAAEASRGDHVHPHGNQGRGSQHTNATTGEAGFMSSTDKSKLNGIESGATADQTGAEIKAAYEGEADTNAYTDADKAQVEQLTNYVDKGPVGTGTVTFDYSAAKVQRLQASGDLTVAHSNWPTSGVPADMEIVAVNWGAHTVTLPGSWNWGDAGAPTFSSSGRDRIILRTDDGGTTVDAMMAGSGF
ncbi:hypothetical protein [Algiphilus aromaticivorans]|uniref:hypothetical protein n=1 Tax=Algiphilus aromaticivorans TaxID=382454 RepID=UPI0005C1C38B|nr:hypothetical protein [Algiphilus aromaticivorans]